MVGGRPKETAPNGYATVSDAAALFGVSEQAIYRRIKTGTIPFERSLKQNGQWSYYLSQEWVEQEMKDKASRRASQDQRSSEAQAGLQTELYGISKRLNELIKELLKQLSEERKARVAVEEELKRLSASPTQPPDQPPLQLPSDPPVAAPEEHEDVVTMRKMDGNKVRRLRLARRDRGEEYTQAWLSRESGLTPQTISELENGLRPYAHLRTRVAIANALGIEPEKLLVPE